MSGQGERTIIEQGDVALKEVVDLLTRSQALVKFVSDEIVPHGSTTIEKAQTAADAEAADNDEDDLSEDSGPYKLEGDLKKLGVRLNGLHLAIDAMKCNLASLVESLRSNVALVREEEARLTITDLQKLNGMRDD